MTILAKINGVAFIPYPVKLNLKMFFDMAKITKSNPVSKRNGVEKIIMPHYQLFTNFNLTAMPEGVLNCVYPVEGVQKGTLFSL
jgi:hypothetical protein